ncbi:Protoglobin-domain-containing protein [Xylaria intraflava]|nr:Protoglobin-domain-containing protein [Xylaria intraflava]
MSSLPRPMRHIDRKDLYTNLETRIQYLHSFLDFSSRDIEALISGSKYIKALIPALVNIVYHKLLQYDITARAFKTRSTSYEGPVDEILGDDSPIIQHRKTFLRAYLNRLCSDPSTMEFWYYLDKVGMMHVGRGREHPLHVEYVHIDVRDGDEFADETKAPKIEGEGYLFGKMVLPDIEEDAAGPSTASACPFSGLATEEKGESTVAELDG